MTLLKINAALYYIIVVVIWSAVGGDLVLRSSFYYTAPMTTSELLRLTVYMVFVLIFTLIKQRGEVAV